MIRSQIPTKSGKKGVLIGLEAYNIAQLQNGKPIIFGGEDVGLPDVEIMIYAGTTAEDMVKELQDHGMNVETRFVDPKNRHHH